MKTDTEKYEMMKDFLFYHLTNNRHITLEDLVPLMNTLMHNLGEDTYTKQRMKKFETKKKC